MEGAAGSNTTSSTTTVKTTTYKTYDIDGVPYRSTIAPRNLVISRTSYGGPSGGGGGQRSSVSMERSYSYGSGGGLPASAYSVVTTAGVSDVKTSREREKKDMQDLNERFASYIEKVRFLEAQNRKLADELDKLKSRWGKETMQIKAMYQAELDEARRLLDDAEKDKARLEIRCASLEEQLEEMRTKLDEANRALADARDKIERQNQQMSDYEAELNLLRRRVEGWDTDREKDKRQIALLQDALNRARIDLDNETLLHIDAENRRQTLEEELEFLKQVHEQEMKELAALAYRDTTAENREFWKNEMGQALREIQQVYDDKLDSMRGELETFYNLKIQEFRTGATKQNMETIHSKEENKRLRTQMTELRDKLNDLDARNSALQRELDHLRREKDDRERELEAENGELKGDIAKLRAEMEAILRELQNIMDTKLGLELEIAAYRKLLEGEESRVGLRQVVDSMYNTMTSSVTMSGDDATTRVNQLTRGEMSAKTTYQRSAKGPVAIAECSADGKFIMLENTGRKDEFLGGWSLKRNIDGAETNDFTLPHDLTIKTGTKIKLWAKGCSPAGPSDLETTEETWGSGANITTRLTNPAGEDRASHVQKTIYT
jgi:intermediate filament protein if